MFAMPYGSGDAAIAPNDGRLASRGSPVKGRPPHAKCRDSASDFSRHPRGAVRQRPFLTRLVG